MNFTRITVNFNQMGGVPCIRGLRIPVAAVVGMVADDMSENDILHAFPDLEREDIRESLTAWLLLKKLASESDHCQSM